MVDNLRTRFNRAGLFNKIPVIDSHTHATGIHMVNYLVGQLPSTQSIFELQQKMKVCKIDFAIVFCMPYRAEYDPRVSVPSLSAVNTECVSNIVNRNLLLEICEQKVDNMIPFMTIDPFNNIEEQINYLEKHLLDFYGIKLHTTSMNCSIMQLSYQWVDFLIKHNLPILVHTDDAREMQAIDNVLKFCEYYPDIRVCAAHGLYKGQKHIEQIANLSNLFVDSSPFLSQCEMANESKEDWVEWIKKLDETSLAEQIIWGTDSPWHAFSKSRYTYQDEVDILYMLEKKQIRKISFYNTFRFLTGEKYE